MKKLLLSLFVAAGFGMTAQPVINVTLTSPTSGSTITAGTNFNFDVTIANAGSSNHLGAAAGDTIIYLPLFNGSPLGTSGGGIVAWYMNDPINAGANVTRSQSLSVSGGSSGNLEICAMTLAFGSSYGSNTDLDTSDACANVTYNATMSVGEIRLQETFDNSFYMDGIYYISVSSRVALNNPVLRVVNISGQIVKEVYLNANSGNIEQMLDVADLPTGIYIVRMETDNGLISINKFSKQ
ncbi:MAG: T9SS type A sorting domain-containing protein [Bacteroidota bacterium]|nr:T9SS type A sorting domain-containing protein [Bacteroidota bacterium]